MEDGSRFSFRKASPGNEKNNNSGTGGPIKLETALLFRLEHFKGTFL